MDGCINFPGQISVVSFVLELGVCSERLCVGFVEVRQRIDIDEADKSNEPFKNYNPPL